MEFHFRETLEILTVTWPYVLLRLAVYLVGFLFTVLWFGGIFVLFVNWPFPGPEWIVWPIGGVLYAFLAKLLRNYVLYLVKAGHIAVITELIVEGELPTGTNQIVFGKNQVLGRFLQVSVFFAIDRLVNRVLRAFNRYIFKFVKFIPASGLLRNFAQRVLDYSVGYIDEAVLSYSMLKQRENPWSSAKEGVILYVQNWKTILGSGVVLALISYAVVIAVAAPGFLLSLGMVEPARQMVWGASLALGLLAKFAIMDPFALTSVIVNYHIAIADQVPDASWDRTLSDVSKHYRQFQSKATGWAKGTEAVPPPPPGGGPVEIS